MAESTFYIKLVDWTFRVTPLTPDLIRFCEEYLIDDPPETDIDFSIAITRDVVAEERARAENLLEKDKAPWVDTSDFDLEALVLARQVTVALLEYDILLVHGSCLSFDGEGYLFVAPSGVGKSTHAALWRDQFGERVVMINDDKPYLKVMDDGVFAYGAPWSGTHHLSTNTCVPLKGICLLYRDETNHIEPVTPEDAYLWLFRQAFRPQEEVNRERTLSLVDRLGQQVDLYSLGCNMDPEAALVACKGMCAEQ